MFRRHFLSLLSFSVSIPWNRKGRKRKERSTRKKRQTADKTKGSKLIDVLIFLCPLFTRRGAFIPFRDRDDEIERNKPRRVKDKRKIRKKGPEKSYPKKRQLTTNLKIRVV